MHSSLLRHSVKSLLKACLARLIHRSACLDSLVPLCQLFRRPVPHVYVNPVQEFRIGSPKKHTLFECRGLEFEEVEKIAIEADGQIVIVLNLAGMTKPNLVDDSPEMGDASHLDCRTSRVLCAHVWWPESLLHFIQEGQYRIAMSDVELLA